MKTRNGFVSNSSSSSFILSGKKTVLEYARQMVPYRDRGDEDSELDNQLERLQEDPTWNDNAPIWFNSCNYDTFIIRLGDHVYIATCNNHPFYEAFEDGENKKYSTSYDQRKKELSILMSKDDADMNADCDMYFEGYKQWFSYISENNVEEAKFEIQDTPIRYEDVMFLKDSYKDFKWSYKIDDRVNPKLLIELLKAVEMEFRFDEDKYKSLSPELAKLFKRIEDD